MLLKGILDTSLGNYLTLRGFSNMGDIEKVSIADENYQRDLITTHKKEIVDFLSNHNYLFFPEVILSCVLDVDDTDFLALNQLCANGNNFNIDYNSFKLKNSVNKTISQIDSRSYDYFRRTSLTIKDIDTKPLKRIDGNHRLSATTENESFSKINIPFCIIFFKNQIEADKYSRVIFHNINAKSIPLSLEENLKLILDDDIFSDEELKTNETFGWQYYFARQIKQDELNRYFQNLNGLFDGKFRTTFLKLFKLLLDDSIIQEEENEIEKIHQALSELSSNIYDNRVLSQNKNSSIFSAFLYYQLKAPELINFLKDWVIKNEIYQIEELEPNSIIKIMNNIASHKVKKIFVAMPYWSHGKVTEYNKLFKEALQEIQESENLPFTLELFPIMRHSGESQRIDERLLNQIRECDIFIAELTGANVNVIYETAFAEGQGKQSLLIKDENDLDEKGEEIMLPFDMDKRQYVPYQKDTYYSKIKSIVKNNLPSMLKQ